MTRKEYTPEEWPDVRGDYDRLVGLARRRLIGFEHHAEDVVSRAVMKWVTIPADKRSVARIEQVIKTEALSWLRSEQRRRDRERKVAHDPTLRSGHADMVDEIDRRMLRREIVQVCKREHRTLSPCDVEILELLFAGYSLSAIVRHTGLSRHEVKKARAKWREILSRIIIN
jgi:hypothetical protein